MQKAMSLKQEPASEPLHISVKQLFLNWGLYQFALRSSSEAVSEADGSTFAFAVDVTASDAANGCMFVNSRGCGKLQKRVCI